MKSLDTAVRNYEAGVEAIGGYPTYAKCGEEDGFMAVAKCLHDAKERKLSTATMVERYRNAA